MKNRGLVFIPDISGYSQFVQQTEIEHSRIIMQTLLEVIINANQMNLTVAELKAMQSFFTNIVHLLAWPHYINKSKTCFACFIGP